ncbi:snRNA-activating protein complex subunit 5 [Callorhinchus milii]|uniref:snRNA-activating protein complex subunit 5 n=1 Tax=Callorhinchus milii TaxID=7868 RepID=A0A4W3K1Z4_CALMI|nr:snRNA-activating protein complex subunit 5 [Callorhinchus milii]|eukprot:gi/632938049/ref/XP_007903554.1/ PREDICTED: snRNA-activating protein complex subunit 5 [Callorhinchus milii]
MLSRLHELKKEEEALMKIKTTLQDQLNRLKVEELALRSIIMTREHNEEENSGQRIEAADDTESEMQVDDETAINQTQLELGTSQCVSYIGEGNDGEEAEEEEEEEGDEEGYDS